MNISRKEFFKKSLASLGEAVFTVRDALKTAGSPPDTGEFQAAPTEERMAVANNKLCLVKGSGCFSCVERCAAEAIKLIPGVGIRINPLLCTGCGTCEYVCPVTPKAVTMQLRTIKESPSADNAELPPQKGELPC